MTDIERKQKAEADLVEVMVKKAEIELKILKEQLKKERKANKEVG